VQSVTIDEAGAAIAEAISGEHFDWYVAITRGGMVPACAIAQRTGMHQVDTFCCKSYDKNRQRHNLDCSYKGYFHLKNQRVLVIDDLVHTGKTMHRALVILSLFGARKIKTAAIYKKVGSIVEPDYYLHEIPESEWVKFPWETDNG